MRQLGTRNLQYIISLDDMIYSAPVDVRGIEDQMTGEELDALSWASPERTVADRPKRKYVGYW